MGSYFQDEDDLNSGPPNTIPSSDREEDLNPGLKNCKSSPLITKPHILRVLCHARGETRLSMLIYDWV